MSFLYHQKPQNIIGDYLMPLNQLKFKEPATYELEVAKYKGREELLNRRIPILDCYWNDVLHFSPIDPSQIQTALKLAGHKIQLREFLVLDTIKFDLNHENTVVLRHIPKAKNDFELNREDFIEYSESILFELNQLPNATFEHYQDSFKNNQPCFLFLWVPHVLIKKEFLIRELGSMTV